MAHSLGCFFSLDGCHDDKAAAPIRKGRPVRATFFVRPASRWLLNDVSTDRGMASSTSIPKGLEPLAGGGDGELQRGIRYRWNESPPTPEAAAKWLMFDANRAVNGTAVFEPSLRLGY